MSPFIATLRDIFFSVFPLDFVIWIAIGEICLTRILPWYKQSSITHAHHLTDTTTAQPYHTLPTIPSHTPPFSFYSPISHHHTPLSTLPPLTQSIHLPPSLPFPFQEPHTYIHTCMYSGRYLSSTHAYSP
ncbi:hypothetical protein ONS95_000104 [Cadophora gregata]|uniref:uncharacterized protein n=1 Tax=Cadophora gregata TaxID=51156 RepID=UPI0026DD1798|nr:uncharacterized protein ONS95_000104 [Cadophora gregata]KAK0115627.1 hypothetical protein ONS96_014073 [Cadophora gregata f. sp. sojae]KAK0128120.1 hypothetical protein ONS95_000104 [Cadophora gregata]